MAAREAVGAAEGPRTQRDAPGCAMAGEGTTGTPTARERFVAAVQAAGGAAKAARLLGCTRAYCDMLRTGARERPGMRVAFEIELRMGIGMREWMEEGMLSELPSHDSRVGG